MNVFRNLVAPLLLALAFVGSALATEKVDINTADAATLERVLVNIGPSKAQAIVEHRRANGPFRSAEQLAEVKGIGLRTVELNRDRIVVGSAQGKGGNAGGAQKAGDRATAQSQAKAAQR
jgi:competence protein ComEA